MKKKTVILLLTYVSISVCWLVGLYKIVSQSELKWYESVYETKLEKIYYEQESGVVLAKYDTSQDLVKTSEGASNAHYSDFFDVSGNYVIIPRYKVKELYKKDRQIYNGKNRLEIPYFYVNFYKLQSGTPEKSETINVKKLINEYDDRLEPSNYLETYSIDNQTIMGIQVYNKITGDSYERIDINIETRKIIDSETLDFDKSQIQSELGLIDATNFYELMKPYGITNTYLNYKQAFYIEDYFLNDEKADQVETRKEDWTFIPLYKEQTATAEFFHVKKGQTKTKLFFINKVDGKQITERLSPHGEKVYDLLTLEADYSIDEHEHSIPSLEEFNKWYKYSSVNNETTLKKEAEERQVCEQEEAKATQDSLNKQ